MTASRNISLFVFTIVLFVCSVQAATGVYTGTDLKTTLKLYDGMIIPGSDSIRLTGSLLVRDVDYSLDYTNSVLRLNHAFQPKDTLYIRFTPLPSWIRRRYGAEVSPHVPSPNLVAPGNAGIGIETTKPVERTAVDISGAKKFSLLSQTGGGSQFSQTLDLRLKGELRPGSRSADR